MRFITRCPIVMICAVFLVISCSSDDEEPLGEPLNGAISCRYTNKFTNGPDCKSYIGAHWTDPEVREEDCGTGFVEKDGTVVNTPCPKTMEHEGKTLPAIGGCHAYEGKPEEIFVISYAGTADTLSWACDEYMKGTWELLTDETADGGVDGGDDNS